MSTTYDQREDLYRAQQFAHHSHCAFQPVANSHPVAAAIEHSISAPLVVGHSHAVSAGPQGMHTQGVPYGRFVQPWLNGNRVGALDTLIALVESGPVWDGDLPSKTGRDALIEWGLAVRTVVNGEEGYQVATPQGIEAFCYRYGTEYLSDAIKARKALRDAK